MTQRIATMTFVCLGALVAACWPNINAVAGASGSPIKIGLLVPLSGPISPGYTEADSVAQARVDAANASGGINGHHIQLVIADTQSTSAGALAAAQVLVSKGVVGVEAGDPGDFEGEAQQYLSSKNIPTVGLVQDAGDISDPTMFGSYGTSGTSVPSNTAIGLFEKHLGVSTMAGVGWGNIAPSVNSMTSQLKAAASVGVRTVVQNTSTTVTTSDYTSVALAVAQSGAQGLVAPLSTQAIETLATDLQQQGAKVKGAVYAETLYTDSVLTSPSVSALNGSYLYNYWAPIQLHNANTKTYRSVLAKYAPHATGSFFDEMLYVDTDLLITGLGKVSGSVTGPSLTTGIRHITSYNAGGLIPQTLNYSISKSSNQNINKCVYYIGIKNALFVPQSAATCGSLVSSS